MTNGLIQKLTGVRDLKKILETTVQELGEALRAQECQIVLGNPIDSNITSICEYKSGTSETNPSVVQTFPLSLPGKVLGQISLTRQTDISPEEINSLTNSLAELSDIIRQAQTHDILQRNTFRDTFLIEIGNVMSYSLGIGDALFMVVNILGKVLHSSRCLFICTDDNQAGWKCYEFWQQDQVTSCQQYCWPTPNSPIVAQTLLSDSPLILYEGQSNSYVTPVQEELQFLGVKSLVGIPLRSQVATHGCVILQQCDYRRAWSSSEIDMIKKVANTVAEALLKLPDEKKARQPIMQLHQRTITVPEASAQKNTLQSVRSALKDALGQQVIPTAQKTSAPKPPAAPITAEQTSSSTPESPAIKSDVAASSQTNVGISTVLGNIKNAANASAAQLDFSVPQSPSLPPSSEQAPLVVPQSANDWTSSVGASWDLSEAPSLPPLTQPISAPAKDISPDNSPPPMEAVNQTVIDTSSITSTTWGDLDAIGAPSSLPSNAEPENHWGNLDAIATPSSGPAKPGLGGIILTKAKGPSSDSPLLASFHKNKAAEPAPEFVEGPPIEIDEAAAQAKLNNILSESNPTSDYIFATPGLDARMLGRIDGWIADIEQKDKYVNGHSRQVAEYATAIAQQIGLPQEEIDQIRQAALLHDVGKLGTASHILQKADEDLTDAELLVMMKHPMDGAELLESFADLAQLAPIVKAHHEEFDGNGYPLGLKGEEIPLAARIINVANSYHSMTSNLTSGPGKSPTVAQQSLTEGAGKLWDPRLVEALILVLQQQKVPAVFDE